MANKSARLKIRINDLSRWMPFAVTSQGEAVVINVRLPERSRRIGGSRRGAVAAKNCHPGKLKQKRMVGYGQDPSFKVAHMKNFMLSCILSP